MTDSTTKPLLYSGYIRGYDVLMADDTVTVITAAGTVTQQRAAGLGAFVAKAKALRLGWGRFPDGMEVIYLYGRADDNFGYAVNLDAPQCSEWGYAPFDH